MKKPGNGLAGLVYCCAGVLALLMNGAGIAEVLDPEGAHGFKNFREKRSGGVRVHVDGRIGPPTRKGGAADRS